MRLLVVPERRAALEALVLHATTLRIPVVEVEGGTLTALSGFDGHQGVALVVAPRPPVGLDDVLARARERGEAPFVLVLDSLEDPQNLGTLLRSAEACGVHGVLFPTRRAAPLTAAAIKASAGATEHLLLVPVDDLGGALVDLRGRGLRLIGADEGASLRYSEADMRGPLALIVGSEGHGISGPLRRRLDMVVRIPMRGRVASLNAAVAGSVLLFAAADQRGVAEAGEEAGRASERLTAAEPPARPAPVPADGDSSSDDSGSQPDSEPTPGPATVKPRRRASVRTGPEEQGATEDAPGAESVEPAAPADPAAKPRRRSPVRKATVEEFDAAGETPATESERPAAKKPRRRAATASKGTDDASAGAGQPVDPASDPEADLLPGEPNP